MEEGNAISPVTARFCEYLGRELGLLSVVKRRLGVTQYPPIVISKALTKMRGKLFLVVPDKTTGGKTVSFGCELSDWTLRKKPFARRAVQL